MLSVAVVTVTYNAGVGLRKTIESVITQSYGKLEYWIMDGKSSDATLAIAEGYKAEFEKKKIPYQIISQFDDGIFDAMNKSLNLIHSDYVIFLNAGDFFAGAEVVCSIFKNVNIYSDVIYGNYYVYSKNKRKRYVSYPVSELPRHMICTHQAIFTKTELFRERNYDTEYKMTADYDFYLYMYLHGKTFKKVDIEIVYFDIEGVSQQKAKLTQMERINLLVKNGCIDSNEAERQRRKIKYICLRKRLISRLPDFIRFHSYEDMTV
jgi:glycosyltransferase involved in cell wall biosynthesis